MNALTIANCEQVRIEINKEAQALKNSALDAINKICEIKTQKDAAIAVICLAPCKKLVKMVESGRKEIKAPVLELGKKIDGIAASYSAELTAEITRIEKLLTAYQIEQERIRREEEAKRQAELQRIENERMKAEEAAEAARQREADLAFKARTKREDAQMAAAAAKAEEEAARARAAAEQAAKISMPVIAPKMDGVSTREEWCFEVINADAFYYVHPEACEIEVRKSAVNALMKEGMHECQGLRIWKETRVIGRS
jgi:hypothetical protein